MENNKPQEVSNVSADPSKKVNKTGCTSNDEKAPDSSDNAPQKPKVSKSKKRKKPKDSTAPRYPLSGKEYSIFDETCFDNCCYKDMYAI